jgi:hypothetical protein
MLSLVPTDILVHNANPKIINFFRASINSNHQTKLSHPKKQKSNSLVVQMTFVSQKQDHMISKSVDVISMRKGQKYYRQRAHNQFTLMPLSIRME